MPLPILVMPMCCSYTLAFPQCEISLPSPFRSWPCCHIHPWISENDPAIVNALVIVNMLSVSSELLLINYLSQWPDSMLSRQRFEIQCEKIKDQLKEGVTNIGIRCWSEDCFKTKSQYWPNHKLYEKACLYYCCWSCTKELCMYDVLC